MFKQPLRCALHEFLLLTFLVISCGSGSAIAGVSSPSCPDSESAVVDYLSALPPLVDSAGKAARTACLSQCRAANKGCRKIANNARSCGLAEVKGVASYQLKGCKVAVAPRTCRRDIRPQKRSAEKDIRATHKLAVNVCKVALEDCRDTCNGEPAQSP